MPNLVQQALDCLACRQHRHQQCHSCGRFLCSEHYFVWPSATTKAVVWCILCGYEANLIDQHGQCSLDDDDWA
ncbi:hypothetical protein KDW_54230 [Dictyobacter vulcani]|uniref:Uncharacterized protein n=1 Tax=Dictyobacter vulcani TaxID=2607529 RepID=A0A5J4KXN5_9CHLR|nr:hypothetical protein [Dictyobacter vulcani]GER91261.1 hypothetical protein KDW_54230 [Dictyobacter vulcani]